MRHPDQPRALFHYGESLGADDLVAIPTIDLSAGSPTWMGECGEWATRGPGSSSRYAITITVPKGFR
jgi:hypothetical protein